MTASSSILATPAPDDRKCVTTGPVHRSILLVDMERSTYRSNPVKQELRQKTYRIVQDALQVAAIADDYCDPFIDRGDGILVLVRPVDEVPKTLLLYPLIPVLTHLVIEHNAGLPYGERPARELRLRAVLHYGEVHWDGNGPFGETLDVACRLLDAKRLKKCLVNAEAPLALAISDEFYYSIVHHGYAGIPQHQFRQLLGVRVAGRLRRGWVHIPPIIVGQA